MKAEADLNDDNGPIRDQQPRGGRRNGPDSCDSSGEGGDDDLEEGDRAHRPSTPETHKTE